LIVGSARNGAYGDLSRGLDYAGHEVEREYYFNDSGRRLILSRPSRRGDGEELPEGGYQ
jgi:arginyl-tRNA synthetase